MPADAARMKPRRIDFGDDPSQWGELSLPAGTPRGVVVVVHGGFWKAEYGIEYAQPLVPSLLEAGWATWAVEYRRVGNGGGVPQTLDDLRAAMTRLAEEGIEGPVVAVGHSAGGHLATWLASQDLPQPLTHVVSQAGVLNLELAAQEGLGGGAVEQFLGHAYDPQDPADTAFDPIRQVPLDIPVHCVHGDADTNVPSNQSETYVAAAKDAGAEAALTRVEGDHFVLIDPDSPAWQRQLALLDDLTGRGRPLSGARLSALSLQRRGASGPCGRRRGRSWSTSAAGWPAGSRRTGRWPAAGRGRRPHPGPRWSGSAGRRPGRAAERHGWPRPT